MDKLKRVDQYCNCCGNQLNSWDLRCSKALAYKIPVCEKCIAEEYDETIESFRSRMEWFFGIRPCIGL